MGLLLLLALLLPRTFSPPPSPFPTTRVLLVLPKGLKGDAALSLAVKDLSRTLTASGLRVKQASDTDLGRLPPFSIVVGRVSDRWVAKLAEVSTLQPPSAEEGYLIQSIDYQGKPILLLRSQGVLGLSYGLFYLEERFRLDPQLLFQPLQVVAEPKMTFRLISDPNDPVFPNPEDALRWGYNAIAIEPWPGLVRYDGYDASLLNAEERAWVMANRRKAMARIEVAKRLHLKVVSPGDVLTLPRGVLSRYPGEVASRKDPSLLCFGQERTRELLDYGLDEVLHSFPQIDAIMVRTGENYPYGPLIGNPPYQQTCADTGSYVETIRKVMDLIRRRVIGVYHKTYIQRAWDLGPSGFHANPAVAEKVTRGIVEKDLILSFKHTQTDFWRYNGLNPNLGQGNLRQMVEFQAAREYEGKGAFPDYLGELFREEMAQANKLGVQLLWVWGKGGGWGGPTPASALWNEVNIYALSHLAWNPEANPQTLAREWAALRFGPKAAPWVGDMLLRSDDAVRHAFYVAPYARKQGIWTPNALWIRDDVIQGGEKILELYRGSREDFSEALGEKELAVRTVEDMIADFRAAQPLIVDRELGQEALNTLLYEKALLETLNHYLAGMFHYYRWLETDRTDVMARKEAFDHLAKWEAAWGSYNAEISRLPGVASPFRDHGMVDTIAGALRDLAGG